MVHQKYKLKFFHYQGLSFIFLHKVHVEAEMQEGAFHFFAQLYNCERGRFNSSKSPCA